MRFGAHVNAHTSFDETVYQLQIPTDSRAVVDRSLLIMEDLARNVSFDPAEIEKERGVVLEEWRLGLGAESRIRDATDAGAVEGRAVCRPLADRPPGDHSERQSRSIAAVLHRLVPAGPDGGDCRGRLQSRGHRVDDRRAFHADSGSRGAAAADDLHGSAARRTRSTRWTPIERSPPPRSTCSSVSPAGDQRTVGTYRQQMVERLFSRLFSSRLEEVAHRPDAPFIAAQTSRGLFVRSAVVTTLAALVPEGGAERGLEALFTEAERVVQYRLHVDRARSGKARQPALPG